MIKSVEFYPRRQGRPQGRELVDLDSGQTQATFIATSLKEEYERMEKMIEKLLNEQTVKLTELLIEVKQAKLHLAGMSDEPISEDDVDIE